MAQVLEHCHDAPMAGHFGIAKTMELVKRSFWWSHLQNFVEDYVRTCVTPVVEPKYPGIILMACYNHYRLVYFYGFHYGTATVKRL